MLRLAEGLAARGHTVDVLTTTPGARHGDGFAVRLLDVMRLPGSHVAISPALVGALRHELQGGYDVVHAHVSVVSPVGYAAVALARALNLPAVVTFHSVLHRLRFVLRALDVTGALRTSAVVWSAVSDLVAAQVTSALRGADVAILSNGIDLAYWRARRGAPARPDARATFVTAMRLQRKKRPRELLRAFARAAARVATPARLLIVGDGPERASLERDAREAGVAASVEFLGWLPPEALRDLYARADAFVMASRRESFGIAALEARAAGLPVVAMRCAGSSEFLAHDQNALLCSNDEELVRAIAALVADAALRDRLARAASPLDRYDWDVVLGRHEAIYQRAMTGAAAGRGMAGAIA